MNDLIPTSIEEIVKLISTTAFKFVHNIYEIIKNDKPKSMTTNKNTIKGNQNIQINITNKITYKK